MSWFQLCRSCALTLSYRADGVRVLGSKTLLCSLTVSSLFSNSPPASPSSPLLLSSPCVICRLHTYTAYLSGSLSVGVRACVCGRGWRRRQTRRTTYEAFFSKCSPWVGAFRKHRFQSVFLQPCEPTVSAGTWQPDNLCVCVPLCTADSNHLNWNEPDLCNFPCDGHGWYKTSPTVWSRVIQEAKVYSLFSQRRTQECDFVLLYLEVRLNLLLYMLF